MTCLLHKLHKRNSQLKCRIWRRALRLIGSTLAVVVLAVCLGAENDTSVVVYSSEDQICSEPILHDFERDTRIRVDAVYDKEAAEVVMRRLLAEKDDPQADVYWANEPIHPDILKDHGT